MKRRSEIPASVDMADMVRRRCESTRQSHGLDLPIQQERSGPKSTCQFIPEVAEVLGFTPVPETSKWE